MRFADIPFHATRVTLRQFALLWVGFFSLVAYRGLSHGWRLAALASAAVALLGVAGWFRPALLRPIFVGWMILVFPVAWVVSHTMLALLFFSVFTPLACLFRLLGRDPLCRRARPGVATYWTAKPAAADVRQYLRQF
jgi:hypothetical protein